MKILLGSSSPRRKSILGTLFNEFTIQVPEADEEIVPNESPLDFAERISMEKSGNILSTINYIKETVLIITCDTIVTIDNIILGKPSSLSDAREKLNLLSGKTHQVISSITLRLAGNNIETEVQKGKMLNKNLKTLTASEISGVTFKRLSEQVITSYLNSVNCLDKAGAYAIQEKGEMIIQKIEGSLTNIIGFPLRLFFKMLSELKITEQIFL